MSSPLKRSVAVSKNKGRTPSAPPLTSKRSFNSTQEMLNEDLIEYPINHYQAIKSLNRHNFNVWYLQRLACPVISKPREIQVQVRAQSLQGTPEASENQRELAGDDVHSLTSIPTLESSLHTLFDTIPLCLEPTSDVLINEFRKFSISIKPEHPPSSFFSNICAFTPPVAKLTICQGAADYLEKMDENKDEHKSLAPCGESAGMLAARLYVRKGLVTWNRTTGKSRCLEDKTSGRCRFTFDVSRRICVNDVGSTASDSNGCILAAL
ncbi:hypothetical protein ARMGADRAFT_1034072 [Armillaria gallica]|uniref:Uncharacterized protein n=1 Tax=Armillaria gallica TaxID=47427 RepID=A0A2H3CZD6_ARMGA|nr:hypothetical protein ARMGADRAFT_1034072 [Armillaria gallica]